MRLAKFRGALASNHVSFFTAETVRLTVVRAGWIVEEIRPFVVSRRWLDGGLRAFAPHLYVVARSDESFEYPEKKLKEWRASGIRPAVADRRRREGAGGSAKRGERVGPAGSRHVDGPSGPRRGNRRHSARPICHGKARMYAVKQGNYRLGGRD